MSIYEKILAVQREVDKIPKSGYNTFNKYAYATEADVLKVRELMNKHGLIAFPSTVAYETLNRGDAIQIIQHIEYTVVDVETAEQVHCKVLGQGEDKGDKGAYKAATGANKYFYLKFAGAPTGDDPEREEEKPKRAPATRASVAQGSSLIAMKSQIRQIVEAKKLTWPQVTQITGVSSILQSEDATVVAHALSALQAS